MWKSSQSMTTKPYGQTVYGSGLRRRANQRRAVLSSSLHRQNRYSLPRFMGSKDSWTNRVLSERLAKHQISTLRFDFFGHGQSDGGLKGLLLTTLVAQTDSVMALMHGYGFAHIALRGSSFGGWKRQLSSPRGAPGWSRYRFSIERRQMKAGR